MRVSIGRAGTKHNSLVIRRVVVEAISDREDRPLLEILPFVTADKSQPALPRTLMLKKQIPGTLLE